MFYFGIDPGQKGAVAIVGDSGLIDILDWSPDIVDRMSEALAGVRGNAFATIEQQQSMADQGRASIFTTGQGYGEYIGALKALKVPHQTVRPQDWMKCLRIPGGMELRERKMVIAKRVAAMFPDAKLYGPKGGLRDGRSDALGIAAFGRHSVGF